MTRKRHDVPKVLPPHIQAKPSRAERKEKQEGKVKSYADGLIMAMASVFNATRSAQKAEKAAQWKYQFLLRENPEDKHILQRAAKLVEERLKVYSPKYHPSKNLHEVSIPC